MQSNVHHHGGAVGITPEKDSCFFLEMAEMLLEKYPMCIF